jgi:hypothetical protein
MKPIVIIHKKYPIYVIKTKLKSLDQLKCSNKFLSLHICDNDIDVYIKCNDQGIPILKGKKEKYSIFEIKEHYENFNG